MDQTVTSGSEWIKSSLSFANGNCVEVSGQPGGAVGVRSSRDRDGTVLFFTNQEWDEFLQGAARGEFDLPLASAEKD